MRWYARVRPGRSEDLATRLNALIAEEGQGSWRFHSPGIADLRQACANGRARLEACRTVPRSLSNPALSDRPLIGLRLDPGLHSRPPVSNMTSNPVTRRTLTAVAPPVERGDRHAE